MVLTGLLERLGLADRATAVLRALDKLGKIGPDAVAEEMVAAAGATHEQARQSAAGCPRSPAATTRCSARSSRWWPAAKPGEAGVAQLAEVLAGAAAGRRAGRAIAARSVDRPRTGLLHRHASSRRFLDALPGIGSVCSGGRYDNLAELFTSQELPGIGASLGLDRLLAAMEELGMVEKVATPAPVLHRLFRQGPAARLPATGRGVARGGHRRRGLPRAKKLGQQLKYADRRGFRVALIAGADEFRSRQVPGEGPANRREARRAAGGRRGERDCRCQAGSRGEFKQATAPVNTAIVGEGSEPIFGFLSFGITISVGGHGLADACPLGVRWGTGPVFSDVEAAGP